MDLSMRMNNYGCAFFVNSRFQYASDLFAGALQTFSLLREKGESLDDLFFLDPYIQRAFEVLRKCGYVKNDRLLRSLGERQGCMHSSSTANMTNEDETNNFMRCEPFLINEPAASWSTSRNVLATILFNNAIMIHRNVASTGQPVSIDRVIELYNTAADVLLKSPSFHQTLATDRSVALLAMAILNNFGYALHQSNDYKASRLCFSTLEGILDHMGPAISDHERDQRSVFAANVFLFYRNGHIPPAAAA